MRKHCSQPFTEPPRGCCLEWGPGQGKALPLVHAALPLGLTTGRFQRLPTVSVADEVGKASCPTLTGELENDPRGDYSQVVLCFDAVTPALRSGCHLLLGSSRGGVSRLGSPGDPITWTALHDHHATEEGIRAALHLQGEGCIDIRPHRSQRR